MLKTQTNLYCCAIQGFEKGWLRLRVSGVGVIKSPDKCRLGRSIYRWSIQGFGKGLRRIVARILQLGSPEHSCVPSLNP